MTEYKLPDWMGGLTCRLHAHFEELGTSSVDVDNPDCSWTYRVTVPRALLTEVKPSLPPEPPVGIVVLDRDGLAWQRNPYLWLGGTSTADWAALNEQHGPLTALVADPVASAPELPWTLGDQKDRIAVTDNNLVWVFLKPDYHSPEEAELRAAVILRAAREARADS